MPEVLGHAADLRQHAGAQDRVQRDQCQAAPVPAGAPRHQEVPQPERPGGGVHRRVAVGTRGRRRQNGGLQ